MMKQIIVIGGGASGMMAAIAAAREGAAVTILEHRDRVGKKILSTGNGRCNFTNTIQTPDCYHSEDPEFPWKVIRQFDMQDTVSFFRELGVCARDRNGYLYPGSEQASAVLDVLRMELNRLDVRVVTGADCMQICPGRKIKVLTNSGRYTADAVILACGSRAASATGSDGSGYTLAKQMGHRIIPVLPALVQLRCREPWYKSVAGVRVQGKVSLDVEDSCTAADQGEIQLTNYGISGIPVFQVSRYASKALYENKKVTAVLNFMPDYSEKEFFHFLKERARLRPEKTVEEFLIGLFHKKLCELWIQLGGLDRRKKSGQLSPKELSHLAGLIQNLCTTVTQTNSFEQAQVCCGGVDTREIDPDTMESRLVSGVYFAGELVDVDGRCGGYNLQWAWSSGMLAGRSAAR
jgi:predicted Rossmann fold flavoprotein